MKKIKTIIVDDEKFAREALREALCNYGELDIINECKNGFEALKVIKKEKPQLIFLDIKMPEISGFDLVEMIEGEPVQIVFVTAFDEFAIKAFEKNAIDYILKPINPRRLDITMEKVKQKMISHQPQPLKELIYSHKEKNAPIQKILVKIGSNAYILSIDDIIYFQAADDYVKIHHKEKNFLKYETLSKLYHLLDQEVFCRVHRSFIININYLIRIEPYEKDRHIAILKNNDKIPISKTGYKRLISLIH
jgi:two-component system LytT family response regulator